MKSIFKTLSELETLPGARRGRLHVHTGAGGEAADAALGLLARMLGRGQRCVVVQFSGGGDPAAERRLRGPGLRWHRVGEGPAADDGAAEANRAGWEIARAALADPDTALVVLDRFNPVVARGDVTATEALATLRARPSGQHVVITGTDAPTALVAAADAVSETRPVLVG